MNIREVLMPDKNEIKIKEVNALAVLDKQHNFKRLLYGAYTQNGKVYLEDGTPLLLKCKFNENEIQELSKLSKDGLIKYGEMNLDKVANYGVNDDGQYIESANEYYRDKKYNELKKDIKNIHIISEESFGNIMKATHYTLSCQVSKLVWEKIKHCFRYMDTYKINDEMYSGGFKGYEIIESKMNELEDLLEIPSSLKHNIRVKEEELEHQLKLEEFKKKSNILNDIKIEFSERNSINIDDMVQRLLNNNEMLKLKNERIYLNSRNLVYGSGTWFSFDEKGIIWKVENNGMDGSRFDINYIYTGGAGATGSAFEPTDKRLELLKELKKMDL